MSRSTVRGRLVPLIAAAPALTPFPGWSLGAGEKAGIVASMRREIWKLLRDPVEVQWLEGLKLALYPRNETCRAIFVTGRYEPNEFCLFERILKPGMTFVDAGANMGLYSLFAARKVGDRGKVLAFEPSSRECEMARKNVELNELPNVDVLRVALSDRADEVELLLAPLRYSGHNTLGEFAYDTPLESRERVPSERLDDVVRRKGITRVDVIKMDVEGAELRALKGAVETLQRFRPVLLVEIFERALQFQGCASHDVLTFMREQGYELYGFDKHTGLPVRRNPAQDSDSENLIAIPAGMKPW